MTDGRNDGSKNGRKEWWVDGKMDRMRKGPKNRRKG